MSFVLLTRGAYKYSRGGSVGDPPMPSSGLNGKLGLQIQFDYGITLIGVEFYDILIFWWYSLAGAAESGSDTVLLSLSLLFVTCFCEVVFLFMTTSAINM